PVRSKLDFEENLAFQLQISRLVGIDRVRFESDLDRRSRGAGIHTLNVRRILRDLLRAKAGGLHIAAATPTTVALPSGCNPTTKIGASDGALNTFGSARAVPLARPYRHVE